MHFLLNKSNFSVSFILFGFLGVNWKDISSGIVGNAISQIQQAYSLLILLWTLNLHKLIDW